MTKMVEVVIDSVRVSLTNQQRIVVLRDINSERYLPIWIGPYEAESITIALQEIEIARPQTHDLLKNFLTIMNARLLRVEVIELKNDVFYGNLVLEVNDATLNIDSRPSDALALAVRTNVPIMVSTSVMETASVVPEEEIEEDKAAISGEEPAPIDDDASEERLSVFEDFLENLDNNDAPDSSDDDIDDDSDVDSED